MCAGVTRGFAGIKLSLCPRRFGAKQTRLAKNANTTKKMNVSFRVKYGWKVIFPGVAARERGSLEPEVCRATRCPIIIPRTMKGSVKCNA
jgi:hypothetical protein